MAFLGKTYSHVRDENFDGWLRSTGLPDDKIKAIMSQKSTVQVTQSGDSYTITVSGSQGDKATTFKSGVEVDDTIGEDKMPIKSTYTVDGNTITQVIKTALGSATFKREFNGDELVVTITGDKFDGVCKRYYKA